MSDATVNMEGEGAVTRLGPAVSVATAGDFFSLLKPRVMSLVVFTSLAGLVAAPGVMNPIAAFVALLCVAVGAGASGALNMWFDADIDAVMARTATRPIPAGKVSPQEALTFGLVLSAFSVGTLGVLVNWVAAGLLAFTILFYVVVYTMWLKRSTPQNIVIGGLAGALPPAIAWAAKTDTLSLDPLLRVAIIFFWTPPHFWALSLLQKNDYAAARVPMLPVTHGAKVTRINIFAYSLLLAPLALTPAITGLGGAIYTTLAALGGAFFVFLAGVAVYLKSFLPTEVVAAPQPKRRPTEEADKSDGTGGSAEELGAAAIDEGKQETEKEAENVVPLPPKKLVPQEAVNNFLANDSPPIDFSRGGSLGRPDQGSASNDNQHGGPPAVAKAHLDEAVRRGVGGGGGDGNDEGGRRQDLALRRLAREAWQLVFRLDIADAAGSLAGVGGQRRLVLLIRDQPQRAAQRLQVVVERRVLADLGEAQGEVGVAVGAIGAGVVEGVAADANLDMDGALAVVVLGEHRAELADDLVGLGLAQGVADEVGRLVAAQPQAGHRAPELLLERDQQRRRLSPRRRRRGGGSRTRGRRKGRYRRLRTPCRRSAVRRCRSRSAYRSRSGSAAAEHRAEKRRTDERSGMPITAAPLPAGPTRGRQSAPALVLCLDRRDDLRHMVSGLYLRSART